MLVGTYQKAKNMLTNKQIKLLSVGPYRIFFEVGTTPQLVIKKWRKGWSCSCEHHAIHVDEHCSHIKSCKMWFKGDDLCQE